MPTGSGLARRLGCSGAPLGFALLLVALAASPGFTDPFTSLKWYALEAVAAGWLLSERLLCRGRGLPSFVRRTWIGWVVLAVWVALGALRHGPAWAVAPLVARASFVALTVASYWFFRRTALGLGGLRGSVAAAAAVVVTLGLMQMAGLRPLPWLTGGDQRSATFGNVNMAAQFVGLAVVVLLSGLPGLAKATHRHLAELLGGASLAYVFLAGTRSVGVALAAALAVLAVVRRLRGRPLARMGGLALVFVLLRLDSGPLGPAAQASKGVSARLRLAVWSDTIDLVRDRPLGIGAGNFEHAFIPYALAGRSRPGEQLVFRSPHNDYLRLLAEEGIPGGLLLLSLLVLLVRELHRSPTIRAWRSDSGALLASSGAFLAVEAFFQFPFEMAVPAMLAAVLLGLAFAAVDASPQPEPRATRGPSPPWPSNAVSIALAIAIVAGLVRLATADVLSAAGREDLAALESGCSLDPRRVEACVQAAWLRSRAGDHLAAQSLLASVLQRSPYYFPAIKLMAEDLLSAGDREAGCRYARAYAALLGEASSLPPSVGEACLPSGSSDGGGGD